MNHDISYEDYDNPFVSFCLGKDKKKEQNSKNPGQWIKEVKSQEERYLCDRGSFRRYL
jgi:hypothetical protein